MRESETDESVVSQMTIKGEILVDGVAPSMIGFFEEANSVLFRCGAQRFITRLNPVPLPEGNDRKRRYEFKSKIYGDLKVGERCEDGIMYSSTRLNAQKRSSTPPFSCKSMIGASGERVCDFGGDLDFVALDLDRRDGKDVEINPEITR